LTNLVKNTINKMRSWKKYINEQKYSECQVITAINAYYYLTGKTISQDSEEYEKLVDLVSARNGSAIGIEKVHKKLGLVTLKRVKWLHEFGPKLPLPIEASVWHKKTGFHSVLMVDYCKKTDCIRIANFSQATNMRGWMFGEDFYQFETFVTHGKDGSLNSSGKQWRYRLFGLKKTKGGRNA